MKIAGKTFYVFIIIITTIALLFSNPAPLKAQQIPTGQDVGARERAEEEARKKKEVTQKLIKGKEEPDIEGEGKIAPEEPEGLRAAQARVLINKIIVTGATALKESRIRAIVEPYEGRELSLTDFRNIANLISDEYREEGYVTSVAYLPIQRIKDNTLRIDVAEGRVGGINLTGNKYFNDRVLLKYITLKKDDIFNYDTLRSDTDNLNEHPDRNARIILARGDERGETDINIKVKDRLPLHATLGFDNYNSRYLERNRYLAEFKSTNLTGNDDIGSAEIQLGEAGLFQLYSARYLLPFAPKWKVGAYYIHVDQELGRDVSTLKIKGTGDIVATYFSYKPINTDNMVLSINPGFEYKDIENEVLGITIGEDKVRIAKLGIDLDLTDRFDGRTILTHEFDFGIPDFMGGLEDKDPAASRRGAGGKFFRTVTNIARIQKLPALLSFMFKGAMQLTGYNLVSSEQFHIGGINTVRGYPVSEQAGDRGYTASAELYIPPYFIPRDIKVPFTETTFFDAIRFLGFFDWGYVENKNPQVGESKDETLYSVGPALRFDIPGKASFYLDWGFVIGQDASDGSDSRINVEVKLYF